MLILLEYMQIYICRIVLLMFFVITGIPILAAKSSELIYLDVKNPRGNLSKKIEFFDSLKNAPNLTTLALKRLQYLDVISFSEILKDSNGNKLELPSVISLDLSGLNQKSPQSTLSDLKGIECFTNLQTLTMNYTSKILDISAIKDCTTLKNVTLGYGNIQSINGFESLSNLQKLTLNDNNISSLKPLENLKNLEELNLSNNTISDTSSYVDSDGSTKTYNNLEILANLNKNGKLKILYLSGNDNIINWSPLSSLNWTNKSGW